MDATADARRDASPTSARNKQVGLRPNRERPPGGGTGNPASLVALDVAMGGLLTLLVACHLASALVAAGWQTALFTDLLSTAYLAILATRKPWRPIVARLVVLGLVAGILELATDAAGEGFAHSLSYPAGEPMLWASPVYMPVSWMLALSLLGYLGWRLRGLVSLAPRARVWLAVALTGLFGAINIPFYEETASYAGWWRYAPTRLMLGHTPVYVLLFEGAVAAVLPFLTLGLAQLRWRGVLLRGVLLGAWMPLAALGAWLALGR